MIYIYHAPTNNFCFSNFLFSQLVQENTVLQCVENPVDAVAKLLSYESISISLLKSTSFSTAECQGVSYNGIQNMVSGQLGRPPRSEFCIYYLPGL